MQHKLCSRILKFQKNRMSFLVIHFPILALSFQDANAKKKSKRDPCKVKLRRITTLKKLTSMMLNTAECTHRAINKIREKVPHLDTDEKTKEIEDCVFGNLGGGFAEGGATGALVGSWFGPFGTAIATAIGASFGSIGGAVALAADYCCDHVWDCHKQ